MAFENVGTTLPGVVSGADLSADADQFTAMTLSSGKAVKAGAGVSILGVLQNKPLLDEGATIWGPGTVSKVVLGATVAVDADVTPDATGRMVTSASGNYIAGKCIVGGDVNDIGTIFITQPGRTA